MAYTLSDLDAIKAAIASGVKRVKYVDRDVEYQSLDDLLKAKSEIEQALGLTQGGLRFSYYETHKGV